MLSVNGKWLKGKDNVQIANVLCSVIANYPPKGDFKTGTSRKSPLGDLGVGAEY